MAALESHLTQNACMHLTQQERSAILPGRAHTQTLTCRFVQQPLNVQASPNAEVLACIAQYWNCRNFEKLIVQHSLSEASAGFFSQRIWPPQDNPNLAEHIYSSWGDGVLSI